MVFSCAPDRRPHRCRVSALLWPPQPQRTSAGVDAFYLGWRVDFPDDATMLQAWTCRGQANFTGFCDRTYDGLLARAARTIRASHREKLYAHLEGMLVGRRGAFPFIPVRWGEAPALVRPPLRGSWHPSIWGYGLADASVAS